MADLRLGLYGLTQENLEAADRLGLSCWEYAEAYLGRSDMGKPLSDDEKRAEHKRYFEDRLREHQEKLKVWMDGDGSLWLGWFHKDSFGVQWIQVAAKLHWQSQTIAAVPLRREATDAADGVAWWRPWMAQNVWSEIKDWRQIVPPGVF